MRRVRHSCHMHGRHGVVAGGGGNIDSGQPLDRGARHFVGERLILDQQLSEKSEQHEGDDQPAAGNRPCRRRDGARHGTGRDAFYLD
jgi:hypothetical protein